MGYLGAATDSAAARRGLLEVGRDDGHGPAELRASETRFRSIFDTVLAVRVLLEPDGTMLELNRKSAPWRDPVRGASPASRTGRLPTTGTTHSESWKERG